MVILICIFSVVNPINAAPPDVRYKLDYVYGYRSADSR